jgi:hypothetical protein
MLEVSKIKIKIRKKCFSYLFFIFGTSRDCGLIIIDKIKNVN